MLAPKPLITWTGYNSLLAQHATYLPGHVVWIAAEDDVCPSASHVGGYCDGIFAPTLTNNLRLTLHILWLGVQKLVLQPCRFRLLKSLVYYYDAAEIYDASHIEGLQASNAIDYLTVSLHTFCLRQCAL